MFEFKIDNAHAAYKLMQEGWPTKIVSLIGPDINFDLPSQGDHHLIKVFHDFEGPVDRNDLIGTIWELQHDPILPTKEQLESVLEFCTDLTNDDRLLVHCHAGRSRSAAMLIGIIYDHLPGWGSLEEAREAVSKVQAIRPTMIPNRLMIRYLDELMAWNDGETFLEQAVKEYWDSYTGRDKDLRTKYSGWKE